MGAQAKRAAARLARLTSEEKNRALALIVEDLQWQQAAILQANQIDAAILYINASTRFTDGNQFDLGTEYGHQHPKTSRSGPNRVRGVNHHSVGGGRGVLGAELTAPQKPCFNGITP